MTSLTVRFIHHIQKLVYLLIDPLINAYAEVAQTMVLSEEAIIMDMVVTDEEVVDWLELPHHMVELIMNKLMMTPAEISDYVRCGAVCTSWRTVFIHHHHHPPPPPPPPGTRPVVTLPPFLMVPTPSASTSWKSKFFSNTKSLSFYNVIDKKVYNQFQVTIPRNRYFRGSSHGWLVAVDQNYNNCQVRLFNPFLSPLAPPLVPACSSSSSSSSSSSRGGVINVGEILLPSLKDTSIVIDETGYVHDHKSPSFCVYLRKAVLSADPLSNPIDHYYIVMAILGLPGKLAYCKAGGGCHDKAWTLVEFEYRDHWGFTDVIYCRGKFYALYEPGIVVIIDPTQNMMAVTLEEIPPPPLRLFPYDTMYLVELAGYLFQVYREIELGVMHNVTEREPYSTTKFRVFRLQEKTKKGKKMYDIEKMSYHNHQEQQKEEEEEEVYEWELVNDISGSTLFLGDNHSIGLRASDCPGFKPNSIYFTDDYTHIYHCKRWNGPHDLGVFNLVDDTIENHYPTDHSTPIWPVPIWIQPIVQVYQTKESWNKLEYQKNGY